MDPALLPFAPGELDRTALRMRPADFARLLEVSKQSVSQWVKAGKITLGMDGLLDPREALRQLIRNSDPARLRSRVLAPVVAEVRAAQARESGALATVTTLRAQLAAAEEDARFHEQSATELLDLRTIFKRRVLAEVDALAALPPETRAARLDELDGETLEEAAAGGCLSPRSQLNGDGA